LSCCSRRRPTSQCSISGTACMMWLLPLHICWLALAGWLLLQNCRKASTTYAVRHAGSRRGRWFLAKQLLGAGWLRCDSMLAYITCLLHASIGCLQSACGCYRCNIKVIHMGYLMCCCCCCRGH
jgi:hypothetical protein